MKNTEAVSTLELEEAWLRINNSFPFEGYIHPARKSGYFEMFRKVRAWCGGDATVLDFGAGPCDKTALFALSGMRVTAFDDLQDAWHKVEDNRQKIIDFAEAVGIDYYQPEKENEFSFPDSQYDVVMLHNVMEHFHSSPRVLMNKLLAYLKPNGILAITVPNAGNLRKRIHLLLGKTNYTRFPYFYWYPGKWAGHIREYVRGDLIQLNDYLGLELLELSSYHLQLDVLGPVGRQAFRLLSSLWPGVRDSWMLVARKPEGWRPVVAPSDEQFRAAFGSQYYRYSSETMDWEA